MDAETEAARLGTFLVESAGSKYAGTPGLAEVRSQAEGILKRISAPVRVMIAGEFSSGKSTLTNLLVGEQLIPTGVLASPLPPVVFRYGSSLTASACWWDGGEPKVFQTADFDALMALDPDYIVLTANAPFLKYITVFDTPGTSDPDREGEVLIELSGRAEMVIWCTNAVQAWRESERHTWFQLSPAVIKNGLLAVTHVDLPSVKQGYERIMARLTKEAGPHFHSILPIDTLTALEAAPGGDVKDQDSWMTSGGEALMKGIMDLAGEIRRPDVLAARELMSKRIAPLVEAVRRAPATAVVTPITAAKPAAKAFDQPKPPLPGPKVVQAVPAAEEKFAPKTARNPGAKINPLAGFAKLKERAQREPEPDVEDDPAEALPEPQVNAPAAAKRKSAASDAVHPIFAEWQTKIDALIAQLQGHDDPESSGFGQAASDTVMEIIDAISAADITNPDTEWLFAQFQEAMDTIILIQTEMGEGPIEDAAILLLQLSRDLHQMTQSAAS